MGGSGKTGKDWLFVLRLCCDGASANRKLWKLHSESKELIYRVPNIYAAEGERFIYFISDPPHLLKTVRNSWYNKKRKLWVNIIIKALICNEL